MRIKYSYTTLHSLFFRKSVLTVPPKIAPFDFGIDPSNFADSASVACLVTSGDLPIEFRWLLNGRPVKEVPGITTVKLGNRNSVLNIDSVNERHAGNYTCQAWNNAAAFNFTSKLVVNGSSELMTI